jgi:hypothetical protein
MPSARRAKRGARRKSSEAAAGATWDKRSGPDEHDGRANTNAGSKGEEPGGRWGPAAFDRPAKIISKYDVRDPS